MTRLIAVLLLGLPMASFALPSDREKPINIEADHAQLDDQTGITEYRGNAILTQGTLRIQGDVITFVFGDDRQIEKAIAQGNRAQYQQVQKQGDPMVKAKAKKMEYDAKSQKIFLYGDAHVWQGGNESTGNKIEYDITRDLVKMSSAPVTIDNKVEKTNKRIHLIIQPPSKKKKTNSKTTIKKPAPATSATPQPAETKPQSFSTPSDSKYPSAQTSSTLNVRTGPGTNYPRIGAFSANSTVIVLTSQGIWSQVRGTVDGEQTIGWVNNRYLITLNN
jgi:lipopolysaccharide export system protein LptA